MTDEPQRADGKKWSAVATGVKPTLLASITPLSEKFVKDILALYQFEEYKSEPNEEAQHPSGYVIPLKDSGAKVMEQKHWPEIRDAIRDVRLSAERWAVLSAFLSHPGVGGMYTADHLGIFIDSAKKLAQLLDDIRYQDGTNPKVDLPTWKKREALINDACFSISKAAGQFNKEWDIAGKNMSSPDRNVFDY